MADDNNAGRNISIENLFQSYGAAQKPQYRFAGSDPASVEKWKAELLPKVLASLGRSPQKVPLNPQIVSEATEDGLIKRRVMLDVEPGLSVSALLFKPQDAKGKLPAILCCHGHGPY